MYGKPPIVDVRAVIWLKEGSIPLVVDGTPRFHPYLYAWRVKDRLKSHYLHFLFDYIIEEVEGRLRANYEFDLRLDWRVFRLGEVEAVGKSVSELGLPAWAEHEAFRALFEWVQ